MFDMTLIDSGDLAQKFHVFQEIIDIFSYIYICIFVVCDSVKHSSETRTDRNLKFGTHTPHDQYLEMFFFEKVTLGQLALKNLWFTGISAYSLGCLVSIFLS